MLEVKTGIVYDFYLKRAPFWRAPFYALRFHPQKTARQNAFTILMVAFVLMLAIIGVAVYFFVF